MYHSPSKRKMIIQRVIVYAVMCISVVVLLVVLVFVMLAYRYNQADGRIEQGGLFQFDTQPGGATVTVDSSTLAARTSTKTTWTAGTHNVSMTRDGYRAWQKTISLASGQILWLNYARLIPEKLTPTSVYNFKSVSSSLASPDNRWMLAIEADSEPTIDLMDLNNDDVKRTVLTLPETSYTAPSEGKTQQFTLASWAEDSRFFLVKHTYDDSKVEWITVDRQDPSASKNITTLLGIDASRVLYSGNDANILYAQIGTEVRRIDVHAATLSRPLMSRVAEFAVYDRTMLVYTTEPAETTGIRTVGYYRDGTDAAHDLKTFANDTKPLHIAIGKYFNETYVAIAHGETLDIVKGNLPTIVNDTSGLKKVASVAVSGGTDYLTIKDEESGRFIVAQHGDKYVTYDLELLKYTDTTLKGMAPVATQLGWLDTYMAWSDRDGELRLYEFDGANEQDIMPVTAGYAVTLSPNDRWLYGLKAGDSGVNLTRVRLIL